jgi:hypothetical protein
MVHRVWKYFIFLGWQVAVQNKLFCLHVPLGAAAAKVAWVVNQAQGQPETSQTLLLDA